MFDRVRILVSCGRMEEETGLEPAPFVAVIRRSGEIALTEDTDCLVPGVRQELHRVLERVMNETNMKLKLHTPAACPTCGYRRGGKE